MSPGSSDKLGQQLRTGDQLVTGNLKTSTYQTRYLLPIGPNFDRSMDQTLSRSCVHVYDYQCMDAYLPIYMSAANLLVQPFCFFRPRSREFTLSSSENLRPLCDCVPPRNNDQEPRLLVSWSFMNETEYSLTLYPICFVNHCLGQS
ncbi:hypothetical protein OOU_Y34scaffold00074g6 [Pyricularia oryzae Y34]|uniref:Uncharacterized protein n=1 Tax=Pyricularia oryzae (strain Y34) TaxID=1143189 RepID=A0AA97P9M8_PYRO3|nr:hypothetical protein OOU_Y34scaffold00074g6 [Pyricularia oryzae Y34]